MNPATDVGKRCLPANLRNRFTEFYVDELSHETELYTLISGYLSKHSVDDSIIKGIIKSLVTIKRLIFDLYYRFYETVKDPSGIDLHDSAGHKPHYR